MSVTGEGKNIKRGEFQSIGTHAGWHVRGSILAGRALTEYDWKPRSMTRVQLDAKFSRSTASVSVSLTACLNGDSVGVSSACCRHTLARIVALGVAATQRLPTRPFRHAWLSFAALLSGFAVQLVLIP